MISLVAKNKPDFMDGFIAPIITDSTYYAWFRANTMVISWILNSLHKNITYSLLFLKIARKIWIELNHRYEQSDGALLYQIQQNLYSISQGSDDFSSYFTKLSTIWDELRVVQTIPACSSNATMAINKILKDQRLIQLLMGLNDSYKSFRGQILMMKPLPTISIIYFMVIQEERQIGISSSSNFYPDDVVMYASNENHTNVSKKSLICTHCKKNGHTKQVLQTKRIPVQLRVY